MFSKIAVFSWESMYSIRTGGLAQATSDLCEALVRAGMEVHLFTRKGENQDDYENINGVNYHRCGFEPGSNIMEYAENMCRSMVNRFYYIEHEVGKFDLMHGHDWHVINA
ncbi:MAG: glycosyltransferase, partial [Fidelibacterota bacterium]